MSKLAVVRLSSVIIIFILLGFTKPASVNAATLGTTTTVNTDGINLIDTNYCKLLPNSSEKNITSIHAYNAFTGEISVDTTGFALYEDNGTEYSRIYLTSGIPVVNGWNVHNVDLDVHNNVLACVGQSTGTGGFILARSSDTTQGNIFLPHWAGYNNFELTYPYSYVGTSNDPSIYIEYADGSTPTPTPTATPTPIPSSTPTPPANTLGTTTTINTQGINLIDTNYCKLIPNSSDINITSIHAYNSFTGNITVDTTGFALYEDNGTSYSRIYLTSGIPVVNGWNVHNVDLDVHNNVLACVGQSTGTGGFILARSSDTTQGNIFLPHWAGYNNFESTFPYAYVGTSFDPSIYISYTGVSIPNTPPGVGTISVSQNPIQVASTMTAMASFTDINSADTHSAVWNWGDGASSSGTVSESPGTVTGSHTYSTAGVYAVTLTVTDSTSLSNSTVFSYISVFNPTSQGLFSAGQRYNSPFGAYVADNLATGPVKFGLAYKYQGTVTNGTRQFTMSFPAVNMNFNATSVSALVISNNMATLTGTGTINGSGNYNFLVTGVNGGGIRIKISNPSNNNSVLYDTQPGAVTTATPTTNVTGNVIVHN